MKDSKNILNLVQYNYLQSNMENTKNILTGDKTEYIDTYNKIIKYNLN